MVYIGDVMNAPLIQGIRYSIYQVRQSLDLLAILPLLFITTCVSGQTPSSDVSPPLIRVSSQLVLIDALVEDGKTGNPIANLEMKDFQVLEDGKLQNISYFSHDQLPLSVVFLFDLTETVQPTLKPLAEGAYQILEHLKSEDEVSIMVFSSHTEVLQGFTTDRAVASAAIERASEMKSGQGTFIHEDMYEAVDQASKSTVPESRRVMVWLTDGTANFENSVTRKAIGQQAPERLHTKEEATTKLLRSGVVVAALIDRSAKTDAFLAVTDVSPLSFIAGGRLGDINRYADVTGGPVLKSSKKEITARLSELLDQLRERYTLGYKPSTAETPGSFCKLEVSLTAAAYQRTNVRKRDLLVRAKRGYFR
jgi:VWFA-related protein